MPGYPTSPGTARHHKAILRNSRSPAAHLPELFTLAVLDASASLSRTGSNKLPS